MRPWILALSLLACAGCAPQIGDSCGTALDCSLTGDRICDVSSVNGQCTIFGCEPGTCPVESVCVRFRPEESRLAYTACMKRCESDGACRVDEGYDCVAAEEIVDLTTGVPLAELTDGEEPGMFCIATEPAVE